MKNKRLLALLLAAAMMTQSGAALAAEIDVSDSGEVTEEIVLDDGEETEDASEITAAEFADTSNEISIDENTENAPVEEIVVDEESVTANTVNTCASGIKGNGTNGISININAAPYTTYQNKAYGSYAYGREGCAWFASARAYQLTGKDSNILSGYGWWNTGYSTYGYSRGNTVRAKALACYANHVAVVEAVNGDTVTVSQGGMGGLSDAAHGYCVISTMSKAKLESQGGCGTFYGYVYLTGSTSTGTPTITVPTGSLTISEGEYHIVSALDPTKGLDVAGGSTSSGANVQLYQLFSNRTDVNQTFIVSYLGNGYYKITSKKSGKALDVSGAGTSAGTNVQQYNSNGTNAQQWVIKDSGDHKYFNIISKCNGLYLDVSEGKSANETNIQMWPGHDHNAQKWKFIAIGESTGRTIADGDYHITTALDSSKGLDVSGASKNNEANIQIYSNTTDPKQVFHVTYMGNGYYKLTNKNSGKCVDVANDHVILETNVQQYQDNGLNAQRWIIKSVGNGYYNIISKGSGLCLDVRGAISANGTNVQMWYKNNHVAQKWKFVSVHTHSSDSGKVTKSATCGAAGTKVYKCKTCGATLKTETIPATGKHTYKTATTKAKPGANGKTVTKCSVCGKVKSNVAISAPKTVKLSTTAYTYNGKAKKPTVTVTDAAGKTIAASNYSVTYASGRKNVGSYKVTVKFKSTSSKYTGSLSTSFVINPKGTTLKSVAAASRGFTAKWTKQATQTTGYQIQYTTNSNFTSGVKTVTIAKNMTVSTKVSNLAAKKKYYVRIRTYKTVSGKQYVSTWSNPKPVITKQ